MQTKAATTKSTHLIRFFFLQSVPLVFFTCLCLAELHQIWRLTMQREKVAIRQRGTFSIFGLQIFLFGDIAAATSLAIRQIREAIHH